MKLHELIIKMLCNMTFFEIQTETPVLVLCVLLAATSFHHPSGRLTT